MGKRRTTATTKKVAYDAMVVAYIDWQDNMANKELLADFLMKRAIWKRYETK